MLLDYVIFLACIVCTVAAICLIAMTIAVLKSIWEDW